MRAEIVITRHSTLVEYLRELGLVDNNVKVLTHVSNINEIKGKNVAGILPLHIACEVNAILVIPLNIPSDLRGLELSLEQIKQFAGAPTWYKVQRLS